MKKNITLLILILLCANMLNAQLKIGYHFKIKSSYTFGGDLHLKYQSGGSVIEKKIKSGSLKAALTPDTTGKDSAAKIKVNFWSISQDDVLRGDKLYVNASDSAENFYFEIPNRKILGDATLYKSIPYSATEIGAVTIPFKYWKGNSAKKLANNTSADFNAGVYVGRKWGRQRFYTDKDKNHESAAFTLALFSGPTKIDLSKANVKDTLIFKQDSNEIGLAAGFGGMISYRNFNIGLFAGWDFPLSKAGQNWNYIKRLWIGFGIGYSLSLLTSAK